MKILILSPADSLEPDAGNPHVRICNSGMGGYSEKLKGPKDMQKNPQTREHSHSKGLCETINSFRTAPLKIHRSRPELIPTCQ